MSCDVFCSSRWNEVGIKGNVKWKWDTEEEDSKKVENFETEESVRAVCIPLFFPFRTFGKFIRCAVGSPVGSNSAKLSFFLSNKSGVQTFEQG